MDLPDGPRSQGLAAITDLAQETLGHALEPERLTRQLVRRLESMGHKVTLEPASAA
jgi:hypothetical protein